MKIVKAITKKFIKLASAEPHFKATGPIFITASFHSPPGIKKVINGMNKSLTIEEINEFIAPPITKATARLNTLYSFKKSLNSSMNFINIKSPADNLNIALIKEFKN